MSRPKGSRNKTIEEALLEAEVTQRALELQQKQAALENMRKARRAPSPR